MGKRATYTSAERVRWVKRWRSSGVTAAEFSEQHGMHASTLYQWAKRLRAAGGAGTAGFTEVRVTEGRSGGRTQPVTAEQAPVEVVTPRGFVVRVLGPVDAVQLRDVLLALASC